MQRSRLPFRVILIGGLFLLACSLLPIPNTKVETLPTSTPEPPMPQATDTGMGLENENLLAEIPTGFKVDYQAKQDNIAINEMVPASESVDDWTTLVTVQIFLGMTGTTPEQYQESMTQSWFNACENSESYPVADGDENGYNFVLWQLYCPLNPVTQKVEYAYLKAIQGNDSFYLIQVAFRNEPSPDEITQWMEYLKKVQVCDSRIPERACP